MTEAFPSRFDAGSNNVAPVNAPNFPAAALRPLNVERHSSEYTKLGNTNVVVFGPKLAKKNVMLYNNTSTDG